MPPKKGKRTWQVREICPTNWGNVLVGDLPRRLAKPETKITSAEQFSNRTKDYGFEVRVKVGGSINDLHPSSPLLKHLKREIDLNNLKTEAEKPDGHKSPYDGATYYKIIKVSEPSIQRPSVVLTNSIAIESNFLNSKPIGLDVLRRSKDRMISPRDTNV